MSYHRLKVNSPWRQAFGLWDTRRLGLQPNGVHSSLNERKRNATQDRWMTDESFPFMRFRMLTLICCHVSPWLKCVCVHERQKSKRKKKRVWECEDEIFSPPYLHYYSSQQTFHWRVLAGPDLVSLCFHPAYSMAGVSSEESTCLAPFQMYDCFAPFRNAKNEEVHLSN